MPTSSITKEFYVKDQKAFERLKEELESALEQKYGIESPSLKEGRELLSTFTFR